MRRACIALQRFLDCCEASNAADTAHNFEFKGAAPYVREDHCCFVSATQLLTWGMIHSHTLSVLSQLQVWE